MTAAPFASLDPALYRGIVEHALTEDVGGGDLTTRATVGEDQRAVGRVVVEAPCVLAGIDVAVEAFRQIDPAMAVMEMHPDGAPCSPGDVVLRLEGLACALLTAERTALNFLQRLSGIATLTRRFVDAAAGRTIVLDTRKTTPTLRVLEKYAVRTGGGVNHRMALDDRVLIKDNHIRLTGSLAEAVARVRRAAADLPIEVEAQSVADVRTALAAGVDVVLVDNCTPAEVREAVQLARGRTRIEVSGGVTLDRLEAFAAAGPDFVSVGALTHAVPAVDISFDVDPIAAPSAAEPPP